MRRGDVVRVDLPAPKGPPGREQIGPRPAAIVQTNETHANQSTVLIVPLTSQLKALKFSGTFAIDPTKENGLTTRSVVLTQQLRAIDKSRVIESIGSLSEDDLRLVETEIRKLLGI